MRLYFERYYPIIITIIFGCVYYPVHFHLPKIDFITEPIGENAIGVAAPMLGFFLTILTIIHSVPTRRMQFVKDVNAFHILMEYLRISIYANLLLIIGSFVMLIYKGRNFPYYNYLEGVYLLLFIWTGLASFRFTILFIQLLSDPQKKDN